MVKTTKTTGQDNCNTCKYGQRGITKPLNQLMCVNSNSSTYFSNVSKNNTCELHTKKL